MSEATQFQRPTGFTMDPSGEFGVARYGDDNKLNVRFYMKSVLDQAQSTAHNTPIYKNVIYVTIHPPGERLNIIDRPATQIDHQKWPNQWQQFSLNKIQVPEGTPVDLLFPNFPAVADTLKSMGVYTIQQLADLGGNAIDNIGMGGQEYVTKAKKYLKEAGNSKEYNQLRAEIKEKDEKITYLEKMFKKQAESIQQLQGQLANMGAGSSLNRDQMGLGHIVGVDVQTERINANHVTSELKKPKRQISPTEIANLDEDL